MPGVSAPRPPVAPARFGFKARVEERALPAPRAWRDPPTVPRELSVPCEPSAPRVDAAAAEVLSAAEDDTALARKLGRQGAGVAAARACDAESAAREAELESEGAALVDPTPGRIEARLGWMVPRLVPGAVSAEDRLARAPTEEPPAEDPSPVEGEEEADGMRVVDLGVEREEPRVVEP
jgi:hypothetical protein